MIRPIIAYGHPILRKPAPDISRDFPYLQQLISDMFETMYQAEGVGLAAPQVNVSARLFVIDASPYGDEHPELKEFKKVFINAHMTEETGAEWIFNEGCLSVPDIREDISRKPMIRIDYYDQDWNFHEESYSGIPARIIQHEYDHIEGTIFVDRINPLRKLLLKKKLADITNGNIKPAYKMIFPVKKRKR